MGLIGAVILIVSCKESGKRTGLPPVSGSTNELMVIMNKVLWQGAVGDTLRSYFMQSQPGLPQAEPMFDIVNLPLSNFDKNVKSHRNVLVVQINERADSASLVFSESPWAKSQKYFKIVAPSVTAFYRIFNANKERIMGVFLTAERDRLVEVYKKASNTEIFNRFKNKYQLLLYCPGGYRINKDTGDFVWISSETQVDSKGVVFFQESYRNESQFDRKNMIAEVDKKLKKNIPGPRDSTWMKIDTNAIVSFTGYRYSGDYYAILIKGLWTVENDFMGGPFVLNVVLDQKRNRIIYMMAYVYAPEGKKRNILRQVESILFTMKIDDNETDNQ